MEGRLRYYNGELVETPPDEPSDVAALQTMFETQGWNWDTAMSSPAAGPNYVMCHNVDDRTTIRIAVKEAATAVPPSDTAQASAKDAIEKNWERSRERPLEWVSYSSLLGPD